MVVDDEEKALRYFHAVWRPLRYSSGQFEEWWRCKQCNDIFGELGPGTVRDRNWNIIGMRACLNETQWDLFKEFVWQQT